MKRVSKEIISNNPQKRDEDDASNGSVSIPTDLIMEILARLPPKRLANLVCVSKLWCSTIRGKNFTDLFLTRSLARPCFLFTLHRYDHLIFLSVPRDAPSSGHHTTSSITIPDSGCVISPPIRGLICCQVASKVVISNPSTGQFLSLPKVKTRRRGISSFFGYDPVKDEYKVLSMTVLNVGYKYGPVVSGEHQVFTLGKAHKASWRMINCKIPHCPATKGICMNGVVYYGAWSNSRRQGSLIVVAFDVRSEEFSVIKFPDRLEDKPYIVSDPELVKHESTIALLNHLNWYGGTVELWVLEDVDRQEWSKIVVVVPCWGELDGQDWLTCRGAISSGEFIFTPDSQSHPYFILSYDRKEDIATRVEIEGIDRFDSVNVFLDYAECPMLL